MATTAQDSGHSYFHTAKTHERPQGLVFVRCLAYSPNDRFADTFELLNATINFNEAALDDDARGVIQRYFASDIALRTEILKQFEGLEEAAEEAEDRYSGTTRSSDDCCFTYR